MHARTETSFSVHFYSSEISQISWCNRSGTVVVGFGSDVFGHTSDACACKCAIVCVDDLFVAELTSVSDVSTSQIGLLAHKASQRRGTVTHYWNHKSPGVTVQ